MREDRYLAERAQLRGLGRRDQRGMRLEILPKRILSRASQDSQRKQEKESTISPAAEATLGRLKKARRLAGQVHTPGDVEETDFPCSCGKLAT